MIVPSSCPWRCLQCLGLPVSSFQILCYGVTVTEQFLLKPFCRFDKQWQELKIAVCAVRVAWLFQSTLPLTEELSGLNVSGCLFFLIVSVNLHQRWPGNTFEKQTCTCVDLIHPVESQKTVGTEIKLAWDAA